MTTKLGQQRGQGGGAEPPVWTATDPVQHDREAVEQHTLRREGRSAIREADPGPGRRGGHPIAPESSTEMMVARLPRTTALKPARAAAPSRVSSGAAIRLAAGQLPRLAPMLPPGPRSTGTTTEEERTTENDVVDDVGTMLAVV